MKDDLKLFKYKWLSDTDKKGNRKGNKEKKTIFFSSLIDVVVLAAHELRRSPLKP